MTATWASARLPLGAAAPAPDARRGGRPPAARTPLGPPGLRVRFLAGCGSAGAARAVPRAPEGVGGGVAPEVSPPPWTLGAAGPRGWLRGGSRAPARGARLRHRQAVGGEARSAHRGPPRRPFRPRGPVSAPVPPTGACLGSRPPTGACLGSRPPTGACLGSRPPTGACLGARPPTGACLGARPPTGACLGARPPTGACLGARPPTGACPGARPPTGACPGARPPTGARPGARPPAGPDPDPDPDPTTPDGPSPYRPGRAATPGGAPHAS